jgi:hypothetical protein
MINERRSKAVDALSMIIEKCLTVVVQSSMINEKC